MTCCSPRFRGSQCSRSPSSSSGWVSPPTASRHGSGSCERCHSISAFALQRGSSRQPSSASVRQHLSWLRRWRRRTRALPRGRWALLAAALALGSIPFAFLGIALGYWASPRGALPLANVLYLVLSFLGALWTTPDHLPRSLSVLSPLVPTRQYGDVLRGAVGGRPWLPRDWLLLFAWAIVFAVLAVWGYRRDEGRRYG